MQRISVRRRAIYSFRCWQQGMVRCCNAIVKAYVVALNSVGGAYMRKKTQNRIYSPYTVVSHRGGNRWRLTPSARAFGIDADAGEGRRCYKREFAIARVIRGPKFSGRVTPSDTCDTSKTFPYRIRILTECISQDDNGVCGVARQQSSSARPQ